MPRYLACNAVFALLAAAGCAGAEPQPAASGPARRAPADRNGARPPATALAAHAFAEVSSVIGPYVGSNGSSAVAVWAEAEEAGRTLYGAAMGSGERPGAATRLGAAPADLDLMAVRALLASGERPGQLARYAVVTTSTTAGKSRIDATALTDSASAVWGPVTLAERAARVLWVSVLPVQPSPVLLWAEQPANAKAGDPASIQGLAMDPLQPARQEPVTIAPKACAWQAALRGERGGVAWVLPSGGSCGPGTVSFALLGPGAKPEKTIELGGPAELDLDLAATASAFVVAWTDKRTLSSKVTVTTVDASGAVTTPPGHALALPAEQALVGLVGDPSGSGPAYLTWENLSEQPEGARYFELSKLDAAGRADGPHARLLYSRLDGTVPELAAAARGPAALTLAPACRMDAEDCDAAPVPTFVRFDQELNVVASEPLLLDPLQSRPARLAWGLTCSKGGCFALAAGGRTPTPLFTVPLPERESAYQAAAERIEPEQRPRVVASEAILVAGEALAQVAAVDAGGQRLVGYVTDFDPTTPWRRLTKPAPDGRFEPLRARVAVRPFSPAGAPLAEERVISLRAHTLGGLTLLAPSSAKTRDALAVWTGLDQGEPQVFLTSLAANGGKGAQRMLTRKSGDVSDAAGLALDSGYLLAWVDERSGDPEVYGARVGRAMESAGPEQRLTTAEGAAAEVTLGWLGGKPYAVWTDARAAAQPGWSDLYGAFLRPTDAGREGPEHRLTASRPHSFAPRLAARGSELVLAWLEEASESAPASLNVATLAPSGELAGAAVTIPLEDVAPRALGLDCDDSTCRVVVAVDANGRGELRGGSFRPGSSLALKRLFSLESVSASAVAPVVMGNDCYAADVHEGKGVVRRLRLEW